MFMGDRGNPVDDPTPVDLTVRPHTGQDARTVIRIEDPHRSGINIGDYFV
jgi:hypothetical protein